MVIILLEISIALLFILGSKIPHKTLHKLYSCYFADIAIPFGFYFLLILSEKKYPILKSWIVKAVLVFLLCAVSETLQFWGIFALARVFDPFDYVMYGAGVLLAAFVDKQIFKAYD